MEARSSCRKLVTTRLRLVVDRGSIESGSAEVRCLGSASECVAGRTASTRVVFLGAARVVGRDLVAEAASSDALVKGVRRTRHAQVIIIGDVGACVHHKRRHSNTPLRCRQSFAFNIGNSYVPTYSVGRPCVRVMGGSVLKPRRRRGETSSSTQMSLRKLAAIRSHPSQPPWPAST
jgi:hypothetical protein